MSVGRVGMKLAEVINFSLLDTAASCMYVPPDYEVMDGRPGSGSDQVYTANQAVVPLEIGRWECMWQDDEGQWGIIEYHDTFRMPNFKKPLTPLGKLVTVAEGDLNLSPGVSRCRRCRRCRAGVERVSSGCRAGVERVSVDTVSTVSTVSRVCQPRS